MPAVSFSQLDSIVNKTRENPSVDNQAAAVQALLSFVRADNPKQRIKASTLLPEFYDICSQQRVIIHEAVFDLCEDPQEHVRIAGYHAIVDLSKRASSVRRKNADVLCQLLQSEGASELAVVRSCLSQHIRTAPEITYSIAAEYLVSKDVNKGPRGPLMGVILQFLDGGGLGTSWIDAAHTVTSNVAMDAFRQRDMEGGKGALLEVSWLQRNSAADTILRNTLLPALSCATLQEAQTITLGILFSLYGECIPLGSDAAQLLGAIIDVAEAPFRKGAKRSPALIVDCLPWFHLGTSTLLPAISPIPSFEPDHLLPRTEPSPLLKALCAWIQPSFWEEYSLEIRMQLTAILGIGLRACNTILRGGRSLLDGHRLTSTLVEARKDVLGTSGLVMQSWIDYSAYNGRDDTCRAIYEMLLSMPELIADPKRPLSFQQSSQLQSLRKIALKHCNGENAVQFLKLTRHIDATLSPTPLPPQEAPLVPKPSTSPPTPDVSPSFVNGAPNDAASRKRVRKELEGANQSNLSDPSYEERNAKRQKITIPDTLSLIQKHRTPTISPSFPASLASRIQDGPDTQMTETTGPKQNQTVEKPANSTGFSIRGAATKSADKDSRPPVVQRLDSIQSKTPEAPSLNRGASIASGMQKLKLQPAQSTSRTNITPANNGTRSLPSPGSPPEIEDSIKRLLLGNPGGRSSNQDRPTVVPQQGPPRSSLIDRIAGANQAPRNSTPATTIFDRLGMQPGVRGNGGAGARNNGNKKKGV